MKTRSGVGCYPPTAMALLLPVGMNAFFFGYAVERARPIRQKSGYKNAQAILTKWFGFTHKYVS